MKDHSLYIAFYPADKPQIAIAAIVENAGFGGAAAAPLVRQAIDAFVASQNGRRLIPKSMDSGQSADNANALVGRQP